jgi:hypothetical protein
MLIRFVNKPSRIIWLGDLNYRVVLSYDETRSLLEENDWDTLLENDQVCDKPCIFQICYSGSNTKSTD